MYFTVKSENLRNSICDCDFIDSGTSLWGTNNTGLSYVKCISYVRKEGDQISAICLKLRYLLYFPVSRVTLS